MMGDCGRSIDENWEVMDYAGVMWVWRWGKRALTPWSSLYACSMWPEKLVRVADEWPLAAMIRKNGFFERHLFPATLHRLSDRSALQIAMSQVSRYDLDDAIKWLIASYRPAPKQLKTDMPPVHLSSNSVRMMQIRSARHCRGVLMSKYVTLKQRC